MIKFLKSMGLIVTFALVQMAWADPALDSVIDDLQKGSGGYYSSPSKCSTIKNCNDYLQQKMRQIAEKYAAEQQELDPQTQQGDIHFLTTKLKIIKSMSQQLPILLKTYSFYPQNLIFKTMTTQGQTKYRQGYRFEIPDLENGFDILSIDQSQLNQTDRSILEQFSSEVHDLVTKANVTTTPAYTIDHITGLSLNYDDLLNNLLARIDEVDYTAMDRDAILKLQLNLLDDLRSHLPSNDQNISRLQSLRTSISNEAEKFPLTIDDLILSLQTYLQDPTAQLDSPTETEWLSQKKSFQPARNAQLPAFSNLTNLSFDVKISGKRISLSAKTIGDRAKERQRFYSQLVVYKSMSPAAQADYRAGKRYTLNKLQLAQEFFTPLSRSETDTATRNALGRLKDEIKQKLKAELKVEKAPHYQIIDITGAYFDYDQILNAILTDIESTSNRPNDRQTNITIDLGIIDKYLQQMTSGDKAYQNLLTLRQKIEDGQDTSTRANYPSQSNTNKNQTLEEWSKIQQQLSAPQPTQPIKITNLNDITLAFKVGDKSYTISPTDIGYANYAKRRLAASNKFSKEKSDILDQLVANLKATHCKTRDDCKRAYAEEIKAIKAYFGHPTHHNYGYPTPSKAPTVAQEIDAAIQEMLGNFEAILSNAFNHDRPQTKLMLYRKLSKKGQADYLNGIRIGELKDAKIFKTKPNKKEKEQKSSKLFDTVFSLFGGNESHKGEKQKTTPTQPQYQVNQDAWERQLLPFAFFDTDDILIYAIQLLEKNSSTCRTYGECANSDIRVLDSLIRTLNRKDPVIDFLQDVIDDIKEKQRINPIDLDTIVPAFKKSNYSPRLKLESQDEKAWEEIETKRNKKRQTTAVPPRVTNANDLIKKSKQQASQNQMNQPAKKEKKDDKTSSLTSTINTLMSGALGGTIGGLLGNSPTGSPSVKPAPMAKPSPAYKAPATRPYTPLANYNALPSYKAPAPAYSPPPNSYNSQNYTSSPRYSAPAPTYGPSTSQAYNSATQNDDGVNDYSSRPGYGTNQGYDNQQYKPSSQRYAEAAF